MSNNSAVKQYTGAGKQCEDVAKYLTLTVSTGNNRDVYHHQLQLKCQRGFSGLASRLACNCLLTAVGPADEQQD